MRHLFLTAAIALASSTTAFGQAVPAPPPPPQEGPRPIVRPELSVANSGRGICAIWEVRSVNGGGNCLDQGERKQRFKVGQTVTAGRTAFTSFGRIPYDVRRALSLRPEGSYIYEPGFVYAVEPNSMIVTDVVQVQYR